MLLTDILKEYSTISLARIKARAELMQRMDNKYVLDESRLCSFLHAMRNGFELLEIDGLSQFSYSSAYWDSPQLCAFEDHNKGRRKRFKIRFRHYHDNDLYYFEIKLKGLRGITHKYRRPADAESYRAEVLPAFLMDFLNERMQEQYGHPFEGILRPSLCVNYRRITLVGKQAAERITIDSRLRFTHGDHQAELPADRYIIEVKSAHGRSRADRWLMHHGSRPVRRCSKYSMGTNLLRYPQRNSRFAPVLRREFGLLRETVRAARLVSDACAAG